MRDGCCCFCFFSLRSCLYLFQFEFSIIRGLVWVLALSERDQTKNERREMLESWRLSHSNSSPLGKHLYLPSIVMLARVCVRVCKHSLIFTHTHGSDAHLNASVVSLNTWTVCTELMLAGILKSETASMPNCNKILKREVESKTRLCSQHRIMPMSPRAHAALKDIMSPTKRMESKKKKQKTKSKRRKSTGKCNRMWEVYIHSRVPWWTFAGWQFLISQVSLCNSNDPFSRNFSPNCVLLHCSPTLLICFLFLFYWFLNTACWQYYRVFVAKIKTSQIINHCNLSIFLDKSACYVWMIFAIGQDWNTKKSPYFHFFCSLGFFFLFGALLRFPIRFFCSSLVVFSCVHLFFFCFFLMLCALGCRSPRCRSIRSCESK